VSEIPVLVVDDHDIVRASIQRVLSDALQIAIVGEANSGAQALEIAPLCNPSVILLDLKMPAMDGLRTAKELLIQNPEYKILIVSICLDEMLLPKLFQEGICGYCSKSSSAEEMVRAIKIVQEGKRYLSPEFAKQLNMQIAGTEDFFAFDLLSEREFQVVLMIIAGQTIPEISQQLNINRKTINSYRSRSFQKLNVHNDVELTLLAARQGLLERLELS
jgi:two-component system invasion response regulator UvrY